MAHPRSTRLIRVVQWYYWMTPVFLFVGWRYGFDVRGPFLDELPGARIAHYALGFVCAWLVAIRPAATPIVGRLESSLSIGLLIVTTAAAYLRVIESAASETTALYNPFTPDAVTSLVLSACVLTVSLMLRATDGLEAREGLRAA